MPRARTLLATLVVLTTLLAGCTSHGGPIKTQAPQRSERHVQAAPKVTTSSGPRLPDGGNLTWTQLTTQRIEFTPAAGHWAVVRIVFGHGARDPQYPNNTFAMNYQLLVDPLNATGAFYGYGFRTSQLGAPSMILHGVANKSVSSGGFSGSCGGSCDQRPPELYIVAGAANGTIRIGFAVEGRDNSGATDIGARPAFVIGPDFQGERIAWGQASRIVDASGTSRWFSSGQISHTESTSVGPASATRATSIDGATVADVPGTLVASFTAGGQGDVQSDYALHLGKRLFVDRMSGNVQTDFVNNQQHWNLQALTPRGKIQVHFAQNVTGSEVNGVNSGPIPFSFTGTAPNAYWAWFDVDLGSVFGWKWSPFDARDG